MFDEQQPHRSELNITPAIVMIACAGGGLLLSFGLCGAAAAISGNRSSSFSAGFGIAGLVVLALSVLGIIVGCVWLVAAAILNAIRR